MSAARAALRFHCASDVGRVRSENQDAWSADADAGLFLVADGMGGAAAGGVAAKAVAQLLSPRVLERIAPLQKRRAKALPKALQETIQEFSAELRERANADARLNGMGATLVLALSRGRSLHVAHLGDSRAYLLEGGRLKRLTQDHSIVAVMLALGTITPEQARVHPLRHKISRFIGMDGKAVAEASTIKPKPGARLLLCTDGLTNMLSDEEIQAALVSEAEPEGACRKLIEKANAAGGVDNVTALVADLP